MGNPVNMFSKTMSKSLELHGSFNKNILEIEKVSEQQIGDQLLKNYDAVTTNLNSLNVMTNTFQEQNTGVL